MNLRRNRNQPPKARQHKLTSSKVHSKGLGFGLLMRFALRLIAGTKKPAEAGLIHISKIF
jgi:hypothetical protein